MKEIRFFSLSSKPLSPVDPKAKLDKLPHLSLLSSLKAAILAAAAFLLIRSSSSLSSTTPLPRPSITQMDQSNETESTVQAQEETKQEEVQVPKLSPKACTTFNEDVVRLVGDDGKESYAVVTVS